MSRIEVTIEESPFGDKGKTYVGMLGVMRHWVLQLESYRRAEKTPAEREFLEADIRGYRQVLEAGSEEIADAFIKAKSEARLMGRRFANNEAVVAFLKSNDLWKNPNSTAPAKTDVE